MFEWIKDRKRRLIQVISAVLYNCNIGGFAEGKIYQGASKGMCVPGLNCYSCPGAIGSCPLGSVQSALVSAKYKFFAEGKIYQGASKGMCVPGLNCYSCPGAIGSCPLGSVQSALVSAKYKFPYYIIGILLLFGILLGRVICGFLCPFGLIQELLYKIPTKKVKKGKWSEKLSLLKYVILVVFVIIIPITMSAPGFCKYICPAGTLEAGVPLVSSNAGTLEAGVPLVSSNQRLQSLTGFLFNWKIGIMITILVMTVFVFRGFCRFLCPLGAFYGLFNKISVFGFVIDENKCTGCNACTITCKLDVKKVGDMECVQCGECINKCKE